MSKLFTRPELKVGLSQLSKASLVIIIMEIFGKSSKRFQSEIGNLVKRKLKMKLTGTKKKLKSVVSSKFVSRSRKKFKSSRSAWISIAKSTGLKASQVKSDHTKKSWRWIVKSKVKSAKKNTEKKKIVSFVPKSGPNKGKRVTFKIKA